MFILPSFFAFPILFRNPYVFESLVRITRTTVYVLRRACAYASIVRSASRYLSLFETSASPLFDAFPRSTIFLSVSPAFRYCRVAQSTSIFQVYIHYLFFFQVHQNILNISIVIINYILVFYILYLHVHTHIYVYICIYIHTHKYVYTCIHAYIHICICICMYVYIYIYIYTYIIVIILYIMLYHTYYKGGEESYLTYCLLFL